MRKPHAVVHNPTGIAFPVMSTFVRDVCRVGQGAACCRWLAGGMEGMICAKHEPVLARQITDRLPGMVAQGDNCPGRPPNESL